MTTPSSESDPGAAFGSLDTLTGGGPERRQGGRRLQDRIAQREAEHSEHAARLAAATPLFAGPDRRRPVTGRRQADGLAAERLDPPVARPSYARFIPREEVGPVQSWALNNFAGGMSAPAATPTGGPAEDAEQVAERARAEARRAAEAAEQARAQALREARDAGYQDGYRDGKSALEAFKASHAAQTTAQMAAVMDSFRAQLDLLEQLLAERVAGITMEVARQVVRHELRTDPARVVEVVREALGQMLLSARHIVVRLHPDDHALVMSGAGELLAQRHARLVDDESLERGGCVVSADIGQVDASVATRWARVMAAMGANTPWLAPGESGPDETPQPVSVADADPAGAVP